MRWTGNAAGDLTMLKEDIVDATGETSEHM
jgi:hypothetical protein